MPLISARLTCVPAELLVARPLKVVPPAIGVY
ncbi:putative cell surface protein [Bacillus cereus]|nr:putative cell surface protein [Bacillus cereus]